MSTLTIQHPVLGTVTVVERRGSRKLSARWRDGRLSVNLPAGLSVRQIEETIERHCGDFQRIKPRPRYDFGTRIEIRLPLPNVYERDLLIVSVESSAKVTDLMITSHKEGTAHCIVIAIPETIDITADDVQQRIDKCLKVLARKLAPTVLIPRAKQLAEKFGLSVERWEIAGGHNVLGTCYPTQRRIRLSYFNVFLTPELRDYIICHELAHLTEAGHTPKFHALCDRYCDGREKQLIRLLHNHHWAVNR